MLLLLVNIVLGVFALLIVARSDRGAETLLKTVTVLPVILAAMGIMNAATMIGVFYNLDLYLNDFFSALETINKTAGGVRSSLDYFNPIGPLYEWIFRITIAIREPSASSVHLANAIVALVACLLGLVMLRRRASVPAIALLMLTVVGVAISGRSHEMPIADAPLSYLAPYNRWGWALFVPASAALVLPVPARDRLGAVAIGIAVALLVTLKVTYAVGILGLLAVRSVILSGGYRDILPVLSSALVALGIAEALTGQVSANLADVIQASTFPENGMRFGKLIRQSGELILFSGLALLALSLTREVGPADDRRLPLFLTRPALMILAAGCAGCAVLLQNHPAFEAPTYALLLLFSLEWNRVLGSPVGSHGGRSPLIEQQKPRLLIAASIFAIGFLPAVDVTHNVATRFVLASYPPHDPFVGTPLADLRIHPNIADYPGTWTNLHPIGFNATVSGIALLREAGVDADLNATVFTVGFSNPFPFALGLPSPTASPIWLHEGRSYDPANPIPPETMFAGVSVLMVPTTSVPLSELYVDTIREEFVEIDQNSYWILYRRR